LWNPWLYPLLVAFIGARQHALLILMHEGTHYRLFKNHKLNDWVSEILLSWPFILFTMRAYRRNHWPHHRHTNAEGDPDWARKQNQDWAFPKRARDLLKLIVMDLVGGGFIKFVRTARRLPGEDSANAGDLRLFHIVRFCFLVTVLALITALDLWVPVTLFWLIPFITWLQLAFHLRSIAEHFAMPAQQGVFGKTRTTLPTLFDRLFLVPKNVGYHLEHHLYPSVPFYNLPKLHKILMEQPIYRSSVHVTSGYLRVLHECTVHWAARRSAQLPEIEERLERGVLAPKSRSESPGPGSTADT
jgi:fatty acid desaturase